MYKNFSEDIHAMKGNYMYSKLPKESKMKNLRKVRIDKPVNQAIGV